MVNICPLRNLEQLLCRAEGTSPQEFCSSLDSEVPIFTGYFTGFTGYMPLNTSGTKAQLSEAGVCRHSQLSPCL